MTAVLNKEITPAEERNIRIDSQWQELQSRLTSGQKSHLTSCKKHYDEIIANDPETAAKMLAINEYAETYLRNNSN